MMRKLTYLLLPLVFAATVSEAAAEPRRSAEAPAYALAAGGCGRAAAQAARSTGGQVINVRQAGQSCVVTLLVPGGRGNPPRRVVVTLPAG